MRTAITLYKTYSFKDKDPVIDELRTLAASEAKRVGKSFDDVVKQAAAVAGMSSRTPNNWFKRDTRRPQNPTAEAFGRALGFRRNWVKMKP